MKLTNNQAILFAWAEVILAFLIIAQLFLFLGIQFVGATATFSISEISIESILLLAGTIILLALLYFLVATKDKNVIKIHKNFSKVVLGTTKEKILGFDRNVFILIFAEFVFATILALSIFIYLDPEINVVPWPLNFVVFFAILIGGLYLFSLTKQFRELNYERGYLQQKVSPAERLYPARRITKVKRKRKAKK